MNPLFDEFAIGNPPEELPVHAERFASGRNALQLSSMGAAQRPAGFDHIALRDLAFDPQIEVMKDTAITAYSLLESLGACPLIRVIRIVVHVIQGIQLIDGGLLPLVPDFIELSANKHLVLFHRHQPFPLFLRGPAVIPRPRSRIGSDCV